MSEGRARAAREQLAADLAGEFCRYQEATGCPLATADGCKGCSQFQALAVDRMIASQREGMLALLEQVRREVEWNGPEILLNAGFMVALIERKLLEEPRAGEREQPLLRYGCGRCRVRWAEPHCSFCGADMTPRAPAPAGGRAARPAREFRPRIRNRRGLRP